MSVDSYQNQASGLAHIRSSVLWDVLPEILVFSAVAVAICLISGKQHLLNYVYPLHIATTLLTVFGTVLGFIVSYRTSSAYERFSEGRRLWASVTLMSRSFARLAWYHVPDCTTLPATGQASSDADVVRAMVEKKTVINLVAAFSVSLKHYLRGESGIYYKCFLPKYALPNTVGVDRPDLDQNHAANIPLETSLSMMSSDSNPTDPFLTSSMERLAGGQSEAMSRSSSKEASTSTVSSLTMTSPNLPYMSSSIKQRQPFIASPSQTLSFPPTRRIVSPVPLLPSRNPPPKDIGDYIPLWPLIHDLFLLVRGKTRSVMPKRKGNRKKKARQSHQKSGENIPLEITLLLSGWIAALQRRKVIDVPTTNSLLAAVQSLSESLTGLERILLTPIPVAYSLHLRHIIWIYVLLLPTQLHATFGWVTVPATSIAAFVFLGLMDIGQQIEQPFGYDDNDLDLDAFNRTILRELQEMTAHSPSEGDPQQFVFVNGNLPFATAPLYEGKSALDIVIDETSTPAELRALLRREKGEAGRYSENPSELRRVQSLAKAASEAGGGGSSSWREAA